MIFLISVPMIFSKVLTLLNGVLDKFAAMEADATVADETDQKNFEEDMAATKIEIAETKTDTSMKTQKKSSLEEKIEGMTAAKKHTAREMSAVEAYLKDLEPACGEGDSSYEDRKKSIKLQQSNNWYNHDRGNNHHFCCIDFLAAM